jgi:uncharacterized protein YcfJ
MADEKEEKGFGGVNGLVLGAVIGGIMGAQGKGPAETLAVVTVAFWAAKWLLREPRR